MSRLSSILIGAMSAVCCECGPSVAGDERAERFEGKVEKKQQE